MLACLFGTLSAQEWTNDKPCHSPCYRGHDVPAYSCFTGFQWEAWEAKHRAAWLERNGYKPGPQPGKPHDPCEPGGDKVPNHRASA